MATFVRDLGAEDSGEEFVSTEDALTNSLSGQEHQTTEPAPEKVWRKPTRNLTTSQKIRVWSLEVRELVLLLGDSNLARIPCHNYLRVQIDSFPGAQIHHLKGVLRKLETCATTQKVGLSVGLNDCSRNNLLDTIKKQFQQLVALTRRVFPNAQVFLPLIQCSDKLSLGVQSLIEQTNTFLSHHFRTLHMVEKHLFFVHSHDPIHWTAKTSTSNILDSWMKQLN